MSELLETLSLEIPQTAMNHSFVSFPGGLRHRKATRSDNVIVLAILEACRTPTVQHWIMVKARLGYDTFWKHMNELISKGMMETSKDGSRTLYKLNEKGLSELQKLEERIMPAEV